MNHTNNHTNTIIANAIDIDGNTRNLALLYKRNDSWYSNSGTTAVDELYRNLLNLMRADSNIVAFSGEVYNFENGFYKKSTSFWPMLK